MCGINGFTFRDRPLIGRMNAALAHRGPDDQGVFEAEGITLGHHRLSIIDPGPQGHQPMVSPDGRYVIVYNGIVYNYRELRREIEPHWPFRSQTDTEVVLAAYVRWGKDSFRRLCGIFALAIWDVEKKALVLVRDPAGVKPLYFARERRGLLFSSEIKALMEHDLAREADTTAYQHFLCLGYIPAPRTAVSGIEKLPTGHWLTFDGSGVEQECYHDLNQSAGPLIDSGEEAVEAVGGTLKRVVTRQLVSDRPLGIYLSSGLDSSSVLAMTAAGGAGIPSFSVGYEMEQGDEQYRFNRDALVAAETARFFGSEHHEVFIRSGEVPGLFQSAAAHLDEPIMCPTALTMLRLSKFAKEHVDVVLTGDGGDEIFSGYPRYSWSARISLYYRYTPGVVRRILAALNGKARKVMADGDADRHAIFFYQPPERFEEVLQSIRYDTSVTHRRFQEIFSKLDGELPYREKLMRADRRTWLVDFMLEMTDAMSMAHAIEARTPFLDAELVELANRIPARFKSDLLRTKKVLRRAMRGKIPDSLIDLPKRSWISPASYWLRQGPMIRLAREVLSPSFWEGTRALFQWDALQARLADHGEGRGDHEAILWRVLTLQIWAASFKIRFPEG